MSINLLTKCIRNLNCILQARNNKLNLLQSSSFHLTDSYRDEEKKPAPSQDLPWDINSFRETIQKTLLPVRITEKSPTISFYRNVDFYGSPRHSTVILFPSEGYLGMCRRGYEIPRVKEMYDAASEYLGIDMHKLSCKGPIRDISTQTFLQPAVFLASLAASEKLRYERPYAVENCVATAGFSIGELTALVFSGVLSFEEGLRLSMIRGEAMYLASEQVFGGLMTVIHEKEANFQLACHYAVQVCKQNRDLVIACDIAHFISPTCKVLGGNAMALRYIQATAKNFLLKRTHEIIDTGGFHTPLMNMAVRPFNKFVVNTDFTDPLIPVYANDTGDVYENGEEIRQRFGQQICKPVQWENTIYNIYIRDFEEITETYICGPSKSLKNSLTLNLPSLKDTCISIEI